MISMIMKFIAVISSVFFCQSLSAMQCSLDSPFNKIQVKGSHNSYHQKPWIPISLGWNYSHPPLSEQFGKHKIRQIELDIHWDEEQGEINVHHVPMVDIGTSCKTLESCFEQMTSWSKINRNHEPILVLLDIKNSFSNEVRAKEYLNLIEQHIGDYFDPQNLFVPDELKDNFTHLREAVMTKGWPSYRSMRGKFLFVLHTRGYLRSVYTKQSSTLGGKLMFAESDGYSSYSAIIIKNDPIKQFDEIKSFVEQGFIVRTRADAGLNYSPLRIEKAIQSGAQFITTDFLQESSRGYFDLNSSAVFKCNFLSI